MLEVGQIIRVPRGPTETGGFRVWRVVAVYLGATNQESVAEIETLDLTTNTEGRMRVPIDILENVTA